ncbi:DUF4262 domain-containing protein [Micromonospora sp. NPDC050686]
MAIAHYGRHQIHLQQLVWPDQQGRFPGTAGYNVDPQAPPPIAHL